MNYAMDWDVWPKQAGLKEALGNWGMLPQLPVGVSARTSVWKSGTTELFKYESTKPTKNLPILILPSLINRSYILDLLPGRSFIEDLNLHHQNVYILEWGVPRNVDRFMSFDDLILNRLGSAIRAIQDIEGTDQIHLLGQCLGGTVASIYASLFPEQIQSLALLTTPVDFSHGGKLGLWARNEDFNIDQFVEAFGHMPWALLQSSFHMIKPTMIYHKSMKFIKNFKNKEFVKTFMALELWSMDNVSFYGECYKTVIQKFYRENAIVKNKFYLGGQRVDFKNISCPILNFFVEDDHIVTKDSILNSFHISPSVAMTFLPARGGHVGGIIGQKAQKTVWPQIQNWYQKFDQV